MLNSSLPSDVEARFARALRDDGYVSEPIELLTLTGLPRFEIPLDSPLQIIPARASARLVAQLFGEIGPTAAEVALRLLDDPKIDGLLALREGKPVGHLSVQALGQAGRVDQLFVSSSGSDCGVGETLIQRGLEWCARSMFFDVFVALAPSQRSQRSLFEQFSFKTATRVETFSRAG